MRAVLLNNNGDFEFDNLNQVKMIEGIEEIKQRLKISLITEMREWFLNLDFGVPWLQMLGDGEPPEEFRKQVLIVLNNEPAIDNIVSVETELDRANRKLKINFEAQVGEETIVESVVIE